MRFEIRSSANGQFFWVVIGGNGEVMAQSEMMGSKASCQSAIESIKKNAADAPVSDAS